ncbi:MAG: energy transducer TonB [Acidobacteriaceae bacterium]
MRLLVASCFGLFWLAAPVLAQPPQSTAPAELSVEVPPAALLEPGDSTRLELLRMEKLRYPQQARRNGIQGQVVLHVEISEAGDVEHIDVLSGNPLLVSSSVESVKRWKYKPFLRGGKPIKVSTRVPLDFAFARNVQELILDSNTSFSSVPSSSVPSASTLITLPASLMTGRLVHRVAPVYPAGARAKHIGGTVVLRACISMAGRIKSLIPVSGPHELIEPSIGAIQQWRYRPYVVDGKRVEVTTDIEVNYEPK